MKVKLTSFKIPVIGLAGAGTGIGGGTILAEMAAKASGQMAWNAVGVKALVKGGIGVVSLVGADKLMDKNKMSAAFFVETLAYGCMGTIFADIALAYYPAKDANNPGGFAQLGIDWAAQLKALSLGGRQVVRRLSDLERTQPVGRPVPQVARSIF